MSRFTDDWYRSDPDGLGRFVIDGAVRVSVTPDSLQGLPGTLRAAFSSQASVGDLETVRRLTTAAMNWALERAPARAVRMDIVMQDGCCTLSLRARTDSTPPPPRPLWALLDTCSREWTFDRHEDMTRLWVELPVGGGRRSIAPA